MAVAAPWYGRCLNDGRNEGHWKWTAPWLAIIGICTAVFLVSAGLCVAGETDAWWELAWTMGSCPAALGGVGGLNLGALWVDGGAWRLVTTGFVHGSAIHLALNMWSLFVVGPWASRAWGHWRALGAFLLSSVLGVGASVAWAEAPVVVGASAGILGLAGGLWVARACGTADVRERVDAISLRGLGLTLLAMVGLGFIVPMIAQAGHLGGLAAGSGLSLLFSGVVKGRALRGSVALLFGVLGLLVLWAASAPTVRPNYHAFQGFHLLDSGRASEAAARFEAALERGGREPEMLNAVAYALAEAGEQLEAAGALVDEALRAEAGNADFLDTKGWILCRQGQVEQGLVWVRRASEASEGAVPEIEEHLSACATAAE